MDDIDVEYIVLGLFFIAITVPFLWGLWSDSKQKSQRPPENKP